MRDIKQILRESLLLNENVKQAEKILKQNNIPLDDPEYLELRREVESQKMIGYLGPIIGMCFMVGKLYPSQGKHILRKLVQNKQLLNQLPKPVHQYTDSRELDQDIYNTYFIRIAKKMANKLTNPKVKTELLDPYEVTENMYQENHDDMEYFLTKVKSSDQKEFLTKTDKYPHAYAFFAGLNTFVKDYKSGFSFDHVMRNINEFDQETIEIKFADQEKELILAHIKTYEGSVAVGSKSWCIVGSQEQWDNYTHNGFQYFLFNFNASEAKEKMIAFTLDGQNEVSASHDRFDGEFPNPIPYLNKVGIRETVFTVNSRLRAQNKTRSHDSNKVNGQWLTQTLDSEGEVISNKTNMGWFKYEMDAVTYLLKMIVDTDFSTGNHLDLLFKKFQNLPIQTYIIDHSNGHRYGEPTSVNAFVLTLSKYDSIHQHLETTNNKGDWDDHGDEFQKPPKEMLVKLFTKALDSNIPLQQNTRRAIAYFLKDNGVDLMRLSQQAKEKRGEELTDMEVGHLGKQGYDLKPRIQNKLAAIRRGEDTSLNTAEITYALDNGFADVIRKYYEGYIPQYAEQQLNYEDMQVYSKLNLLDKVAPYIIKKGNMYGMDSLNSIEGSIYSQYNR